MEAKWIHKVIKVGTSHAVIIPPKILSACNLRLKDAVVLTGSGGEKIIIQSLASYLAQSSAQQSTSQITKL